MDREHKIESLKTFFIIGMIVIIVILVLRFTMDESYEKAYTLAQEKCREQGFVDVKDFSRGTGDGNYTFECEQISANFIPINNGTWGMIYYENNFTKSRE